MFLNVPNVTQFTLTFKVYCFKKIVNLNDEVALFVLGEIKLRQGKMYYDFLYVT